MILATRLEVGYYIHLRSGGEERKVNQENQQVNEIDPNKVGCRVVDVHNALQKAFTQFAESGEDSLDNLARRVHECLSEMPAFLIGEPQV
jgi:hypothetical protein